MQRHQIFREVRTEFGDFPGPVLYDAWWAALSEKFDGACTPGRTMFVGRVPRVCAYPLSACAFALTCRCGCCALHVSAGSSFSFMTRVLRLRYSSVVGCRC